LSFSCHCIGQGNSIPVPAGDTLQVKEWLYQSEVSRAKNPDDAIQSAQKALTLSEKMQYRAGLASSYAELGDLFLQKKDYTKALAFYEKAQPILIETGNDHKLGKVLKNTGDIYSVRSYFRQAFDHYREAANYLRRTGQLKLLNECQDAMGNLTLEFGQIRGAINHFKRSLIVKTNLNDDAGVITTTAKISKIYLSLKQYDSALYFNKEVQRLAKNDAETLTDAAIDELIILSFLGKLNEAAVSKATAEKLVLLQNNTSNKIKLLAAASNYYLAQKDKEMHKKYFDSAAALIIETRSAELAVAGLSQLAEMSSQNEDYTTAYRMLKLMDRYKDIFRNENMERISAEIKNASETSLKEKEIEHLSRENNLKADKLSKETLLRLALIRQNLLIDSSLGQQQLLTAAKEVESNLRNEQLTKEKELSLLLGRENELNQQRLNAERKNKKLLWFGIGALAILGSIIYIQYRKQLTKNAIINKQSGELQVLNKEIHHRVKNNLQVISSMLDLQSQSLNDQKATEIIKEGIQRVQSMAFIHQNLYQGNAVNSVNMNEYIKMLSNHLFQTYNIRPEKINLHTEIENFNLHTDTAIPLGMILNELISNSLKYAFKGKEKGDIWVTMKKNNNELLLQVKDNGVGLPAGFSSDNTSSFGYEIIKAFAQKLRARMNVDGSSGTDVQLIISKFKTAE
jgi:two-component system, sensor histidine kinase PdtaS